MSPAARRRALALALVAVLVVAAGAFALGRASREDQPDGTAPPARTTENRSDVPEIPAVNESASLPALEQSPQPEESTDTGGDSTGETTGTATSPDTDSGTGAESEPDTGTESDPPSESSPETEESSATTG